MKNLVARFVKDESGATAIEYGLIAAGIALAIITVVNNLGTTLNAKFGSISSSLKYARRQAGIRRAPSSTGLFCFVDLAVSLLRPDAEMRLEGGQQTDGSGRF